MSLIGLFFNLEQIGLQVMMDALIGPGLREMYPEIVNEYNTFEDVLEDAIGKNVALPETFANIFLNKAESLRQNIVTKIANFIKSSSTVS